MGQYPVIRNVSIPILKLMPVSYDLRGLLDHRKAMLAVTMSDGFDEQTRALASHVEILTQELVSILTRSDDDLPLRNAFRALKGSTRARVLPSLEVFISSGESWLRARESVRFANRRRRVRKPSTSYSELTSVSV